MTTTESFSDRSRFFSLYKASLKSLYPMMVIFTIVFFLAIPLVFITGWINGDSWSYNFYLEGIAPRYGIYVDESQSVLVYVLIAAMALILALFLSAYMHQKKNVDLYHAIPVTRPQLLNANMSAAITAIAVPFLAMCLLTVCLQAIAFAGLPLTKIGYHWHNIQDFAGAILYALIIYLFVTFISVNVGTLFDTFAISLTLGFSVMFIYVVAGFVWADLTYGADFDPGMWILLLSPFTFAFFKYDFMVYRDELMVFPFVKTLLFLACMLALAAVIYFLSLWSYKRRKSEIAEQAMGGGAFQTVVKIFVSFAGAALLYAIFADAGIVGQGIAVFFGALLIGAIAELVFSRGIRFFLKNIKWLAGTGAVCCILMVAAHLDFIGYTTRVPSLQSIESVSINYTGRFTDLVSNSWYYRNGDDAILTSPDSIDIVTQMHKLAVENQPGDRYYNPEHPYGNIRIKYKLKSGMTMERYYNQLYHEALTTLADLEDKDDYITLNSPAFYMDHADSPQTELIRRVTISSSLRDTNHDVRLGAQETQRLLEAVRADMLAESLSEIKAPTQPALGYLQFEYYSNEDYDPEYYYYYKDTALINTVIVTHEYAHTIAALRELGLYDKFAPTEEADSVYILQSDYYDMPRVRALGSQSYDDHFFQSVYSYMASDSTDDGSSVLAASEDAATVREIESAAANQLLMADPSRYNSSSDPDAYIETMTYNVVFCRDGKALGLKMIRFDQLPQNLRQQVVDYYQTDRDYSLGYTAEAVSDGIIL